MRAKVDKKLKARMATPCAIARECFIHVKNFIIKDSILIPRQGLVAQHHNGHFSKELSIILQLHLLSHLVAICRRTGQE